MPYNNTPITPSKEVTGTAALPLARVKKIIAADDDISNCSNNASFVITVAAEMFLQHLVEQSYNIVKSERKPRRNIQYRDVANAVARVENLEFLTDVVPKTTSYRQIKQKQAKDEMSAPQANGATNGQGTLDAHVGIEPADRPVSATGEGDSAVGGAQGVVEIPPTNGTRHDAADVMDVDDAGEEASMHTANDEPEPESVMRQMMDVS